MSKFSSLKEDFNLTDHDLKKPISDVILGKISTTLHIEWRKLPSYLGLKHGVVKDIQYEQGLDEEERRDKFLRKWKAIKQFEATYECLISALLQVENLEDAEGVCELYRKNPHSAALGRWPAWVGLITTSQFIKV